MILYLMLKNLYKINRKRGCNNMLKRYKMFSVFQGQDVYTYTSGGEPKVHLIGSRRDNNTSSVFTEPNKRTSRVNIKIRTNDEKVPTSNDKRYNIYAEHLKNDKIEVVSEILNEYKIQIDFALFDESMNLVDEGIKFYRANADDLIEVSPIKIDNRMTYNISKEINGLFQFHGQGMMPRSMGVTPSMMIGVKGTGRYLQINSISILGKLAAGKNEDALKLHPTLNGMTFKPTSATITSIKENMIELYKTPSGMFNIIDLGLEPYRIDLSVSVIIDSFLTPYNTDEIDSIIQWNIENIGESTDDDDDFDIGEDGVERSDLDISFSRCNMSNPQALQVVKNDIPDESYDQTKMVKLKYVLKTLPDARIGDVVLRTIRINVDDAF